MASKFRNSGQTCVCTNRLLVQAGVHDALVEAVSYEMSKLNMGHGLDPNTTIGPLIDAKAKAKVAGLVAGALADGAERAPLPAYTDVDCDGSLFHEPTLLLGVQPSMRIAAEEIFGPVLPIMKFEEEAEALRIANDTPYGLAAYFFSSDMAQCFRVAEALDYGMVGINEGLISNEVAPFGGVKASGLGREGSIYGTDEYTEMKYICIGNLS
mmetsp:Transcript_1912/g.5631  ORF Transcript_1912/g.5631 Transcript_1912/m.5631 type:complete len:211 (-) Transcript_1912:3492-4124(-)